MSSVLMTAYELKKHGNNDYRCILWGIRNDVINILNISVLQDEGAL